MAIALHVKQNLAFVIATAMVTHGKTMILTMKFGKTINLNSL